MSLTKTSDAGNTQDVVQLVTRKGGRKVPMGISADGMGHILARLTDLYTDPVKATAREVISNAIDATVMLSPEHRKPVEVFMPSNLRSAFIVRDHGVGMSEDTVLEIYSQYGSSTKEKDMTQIGAYGLGAKAPLAYCSEFLVVTIHDGIRTEFTISRTSAGNFVDITDSTPTDEPSGTTVTIPVKLNDAGEFSKALESYKTYSFDVPIAIDGQVAVSPEFLLIESDFVLHTDEETGEETTGRVWVRRESILDYFEQKYKPTSRTYDQFRFTYVLSGWAYTPPAQRGGYFRSSPSVVFELKPGVVDFSSSRDEITNNERSRILDKRALEYVRASDRGTLESLLTLYRRFDRQDAEAFFMAALWHGKIEKNKFVLPHSAAPVEFSAADLQTEQGYSPLDPFIKSYKPNLRTAFVLALDSKEQRVLNSKALEDNVSLFDLRGSLFPSTKVSQGNAILQTEFSRDKTVLSVAELLLHYYAQTKAKLTPNNMQKIVVVTDADETTLKRLMGYRKLLVENNYSHTLFVFAREGKSVESQLKAFESYAGIKAEVKTMEELLNHGKELRKVVRSENGTGPTEMFNVTLLDATEITEEAKVVEAARVRYLPNQTVTVGQLEEEAALLVLTKTSSTSALVGAANNGVRITGRKIYITTAYHGMRASHFKDLEAYGDYVVASDFAHKGKQAEAVIANNRYSGRVLHSSLRSADTTDIYKSVLGRYYIEKNFYAAMAAFLRKNHSSNRTLIEFFDFGATKFNRYSGTSLGALTDSELRHALTPAQYKVVRGFSNAYEATRDSSSFQAQLMNELWNFSGEFGHYGDLLMEELYRWITDGVPKRQTED